MSHAPARPRHQPPPAEPPVPPLENGDRLARPEFERRYDAMPHVKKAELIEGVVHMASPVKHHNHGRPHFHASKWLGAYVDATPGVDGGDNSTIRLDLDNMPQPDAFLYIDPAAGGQARFSADDYLEAAPELIVEVASSSASYDLNTKLNAYRRNGVREYVVWKTRERQVAWFVLVEGRYEELAPEADGLFRSRVLPGLWLDPGALMNDDRARMVAVNRMGTESAEHLAFVEQLRMAAAGAPPRAE